MNTVLVIDPDPHAFDALAGHLRSAGFEVRPGRPDGDEDQLRGVDCVVSEIVLPGQDGFELCRRLTRSPAAPRVPVVLASFLSAGPRASECGASAFVLKPANREAVVGAVRRAIETAGEVPHQASEAWRHDE